MLSVGFFRTILLLFLASCVSLPHIVENSTSQEVRLIIEAEPSLFDDLSADGIFYEPLNPDRSGTCADGKRIAGFHREAVTSERYLVVLPGTRICFLTRIDIEGRSQQILILDGQRKIPLKNRFDYYRTSWDVPGKVFVYEENNK